MIDTDKYEGHTPVWYLHGETGAWWVQSDFTTHDDFVVAEVRSQNEVDAQLIADAPLLLEEYVRLRHCLRYVGARLFLDKNGRRPYDYTKLLEFCMDNTGEPDDLSGKMGAMIEELSHLDEKLEVDKEMIE